MGAGTVGAVAVPACPNENPIEPVFTPVDGVPKVKPGVELVVVA